jgi:REP element-mobilizing transposase RayT
MARQMRLELEGGIYHVLNRGNYRADLFRGTKTRAAFLKCLDEACGKTEWRVHAWCIMSNHYHLAVETPHANLVEGMRWLQGTFSVRFNRLRRERGHLFQGRYKSLLVDPGDGLGPLCHYIHLNPVRAHVCAVERLGEWGWSSVAWLMDPKLRRPWFDPRAALGHAGGLADTPAGRRKYLEYLGWLAEDEPARKVQRFDQMSQGWVIGSREFTAGLIEEQGVVTGQGRRLAAEHREASEAVWQATLRQLIGRLGRTETELASSGKSVDWKIAVAAVLKARTTVTNRWLGTALHLGNLYEVSRKVAAWTRDPEPALRRKLKWTPNPKA